MIDRIDGERMVQQLAALAQPSRLAAVRLLARYRPFGLPAGDIARLIAVPHNTLSSHLGILEEAGLVRSRRDGRLIIYAAEPNACALLAGALSHDLDPPARRGQRAIPVPILPEVADNAAPYRVLVLCTANSARSLMAEALINREGRGRFRATSAGSCPASAPNAAALSLLADLGYPTATLVSKSWDDVAATHEAFDFVITVCDRAAREPCPALPGHPLLAHWGIPDPVQPWATAAEEKAAMLAAYRQLAARVTAFVTLPLGQLDLATLKAELAAIGRLDGATALARSGQAA